MKLALGLFFAFALVAFLVASAAAHSRESEGTYDYDRPERGGRMHRGGDTVRVVREREVEVRRGGRGGRGRGRDWRMMPRKGWWDDQYKQFCPSPNYTPTCWKFRDYGIWCPGPRCEEYWQLGSDCPGSFCNPGVSGRFSRGGFSEGERGYGHGVRPRKGHYEFEREYERGTIGGRGPRLGHGSLY